MRDCSELWKELAASGAFSLNVRAIIDGKTYTAITAPTVNRALLTEPLSVGNCVAADISFSVLTDDEFSRGAKIQIDIQLVDEQNPERATEWKTMGTFLLSTRLRNNDMWEITAYDAMLQTNQDYIPAERRDEPDIRVGWPKTMRAAVEEIAATIGVEVDPRTKLEEGEAYRVPFPDDLTMFEVLGNIGACHAGNWIITEENKLRLIPVAVENIFVSYNILDMEYSRILTNDGKYKLVYYIPGENVGRLHVPVVIGKFKTGDTITVGRISMTREDGTTYTAGEEAPDVAANDNALIEILDNPYACQQICDDLYAKYKGSIYVPYEFETACYDPASELGDWVIVGERLQGYVCSTRLTYGALFRADSSAPSVHEADDEYPYAAPTDRLRRDQKKLFKEMKATQADFTSRIEQTREDITLAVTAVTALDERVKTAEASITLNSEAIEQRVSKTDFTGSTVASLINQSAEEIYIEAAHIRLEGLVTANENFKVLEDGSIEAVNAKLSGDLVLSGNISLGGNINIGGNITWGAENSPVCALYGQAAYATPVGKYSTFPAASTTGWHKTVTAADLYESLTYDGGESWTAAVKIQGTDGASARAVVTVNGGTTAQLEEWSAPGHRGGMYPADSAAMDTLKVGDQVSLRLRNSDTNTYVYILGTIYRLNRAGEEGAVQDTIWYEAAGMLTSGKDGSDASVTRDNIATAIYNNLASHEDDGIYSELVNGKYRIGINAAAIRTGILDALKVTIAGSYGGLIQGSGMAAGGETTTGIGLFGPKGYTQTSNAITMNPPYVFLSNKGFRVQDSANTDFYLSGGALTLECAFRPYTNTAWKYLNWVEVKGADNKTYQALCGFSSPPQ